MDALEEPVFSIDCRLVRTLQAKSQTFCLDQTLFVLHIPPLTVFYGQSRLKA